MHNLLGTRALSHGLSSMSPYMLFAILVSTLLRKSSRDREMKRDRWGPGPKGSRIISVSEKVLKIDK